jgi:hypothetical protein
MAMDVEGIAGAEGMALRQANLLRTSRRLFSGEVAIPASIWSGSGKANNVVDITEGITF